MTLRHLLALAALCLAGCASAPVEQAPASRPAGSQPTSRPTSPTKAAPATDPVALAVAKAYGLERFGEVRSLAFTFNVERGGKQVHRRWRWEVPTDTVTAGEGPKAVSLRRSEVTDATRKLDAAFTNDQFWLLFPLHLAWDRVKVERTAEAKLPIGDGQAERLVVTYPPTGGYTPGDVYEAFLDGQRHLVQWTFRRGGQPGGKSFTWDAPQAAGPLLLCLSHRDAKRSFHLWFSDVVLETTAGETFRVSAKTE